MINPNAQNPTLYPPLHNTCKKQIDDFVEMMEMLASLQDQISKEIKRTSQIDHDGQDGDHIDAEDEVAEPHITTEEVKEMIKKG